MIELIEIEAAKLQHAERVKQVAMARLACEASAGQPALTFRLRMRAGDLLIHWGRRLKAHDPASPEDAIPAIV